MKSYHLIFTVLKVKKQVFIGVFADLNLTKIPKISSIGTAVVPDFLKEQVMIKGIGSHIDSVGLFILFFYVTRVIYFSVSTIV